MSKFFDKKDLNINVNDVGKMVSQYWDFINHNNKKFSPMTYNPDYLVKAHFHEEIGRGGYFSPESGTSEGQFLTIRGALNIYKVTKDLKWLSLAEELMQAALKYLYKGVPMPEKVDEDNLWLPHWLFNASEEFTAEEYYLNHKATFKNGVATITAAHEMREVYTVRSLDAELEWPNPYALIIGKEYKIKNYTMKDNTATITLNEKLNGEAYVVYADLGGPQIQHNELYEAWPIWRKLQVGETACAIDSLWWAYDCFKMLAECTGKAFYKKATRYTLDSIVEVMKVSNMNDWHITTFKYDDPYSGTIGLYSWQNREPEATFKRDKNDGSVIIDIPKGEGQVQYGRGGISVPFMAHNSIEVKMASNVDTKVTLFISPVAGGTMEQRFTAHLKLKGDNVVRKYQFTHEDFIKTGGILWDHYFLPDYTSENIYCSDHSKLNIKVAEDSKGREWSKVEFIVGKEITPEGNAFLGWSQFHPIIVKDLFDHMSIPNFNLRLTKGAVNLRIQDNKGFLWEIPVPKTTAFISFKPSIKDFKFSDYQKVSGTAANITFPIKEFVFDALEDSCLELKYIGDIKTIPAGTNINDFVINMEEDKAQTIKVFYSRPLPLEGYDYTPYVAPFTVNTVNFRVDAWRGTPYTGYQCAWIWQEVGDPKGLETVLSFMKTAQDEYKKSTGVEGFFMPLFLWDRWDSRQYGEPNTFTWNGPDPNTHWGGFQYRGVETVARAFFNDPSNKLAKDITWKFIKAVEKIWNDQGSYPVTFEENKKPVADYKEPHIVGLLLRILIYYYQATDNKSEEKICLNLISRSVNELLDLFHPFNNNMVWNSNFINGTWSTKNSEWYMFWGGEILSALALLMQYSKNEFIIKTNYGKMLVETFPDLADIPDYVKIKTPIGIQKAALVPANDSSATPIRIKTSDEIKAIGGVKMSAELTKEIKLLIKNEGNALKECGSLMNHNTFKDIKTGLFKIENIKGEQYINMSPRKTYNYAENNWDNIFPVEAGKDIAFRFEVVQGFNSVLTMVFKDAEGNDFGWEDIGNMSKTGTVYYTKKVPNNAATMVLYLQEQGELIIDEIMILYGDFSKRQMPAYFQGTKYSCEIMDSKSLEIKVEKDNKIVDSLKLTDIVPEEYLPLIRKGEIYDEIEGNVLYKRFNAAGEQLEKEEIIILNNTISLLESQEGASLELYSPLNLLPTINIKYPVDMKQYIKEIVNE